MITLRQPVSFSELGSKDNQEDAIFPLHPTADDHVFVLCDGMGGHERGEVASTTVTQILGDELQRIITRATAITPDNFDHALNIAYDALDRIPGADSDRKPGTTLAALCVNGASVLAAHIGDSRIYHIRPSEYDPEGGKSGIIYRSEDHSLVNDLVKAGHITPQQARVHPRRNIITRAMQPHLERRFKASVHESDDVRPGDYFFLCSDGVLERVDDRSLCEILSTPGATDIDKLNSIKSLCDTGTRDNYTCILIPVADVTIAQKESRHTALLAILTAAIVIIGVALAIYCSGKSTTGSTPAVTDTVAVAADTAKVDTIVLASPPPDSLNADSAAMSPAPVDIAAPDTVDKPKPSTTKTDTVGKPTSSANNNPNVNPVTDKAELESVTPATDEKAIPAGAPSRDKKGVPPPRKDKSSTPKPLA